MHLLALVACSLLGPSVRLTSTYSSSSSSSSSSHRSSSDGSSDALGSSRAVARAREIRRSRTPVCLGPPLPGLNSRAMGGNVPVEILVTGMNSRRISASIVVDAAPNQVWSILTDYDNLATHVPNLVESSLRPHPTGGIRLFQEGAQTIVGFNFRASLTMDMLEVTEDDARAPDRIRFKLVDSQMFAAFDGEWRVQAYSRSRSRTDPSKFEYKSKLSYLVNITPKGLVPVPALEWRIREDVPINLKAVKVASEKRARKAS